MARTAFQADRDGFAFVNSWTFTHAENEQMQVAMSNSLSQATGSLGGQIPAFVQNSVISQARGWIGSALPEHYGLCGGMAFAARDYFLVKRPLPRGSGPADHPDPNTPHGRELRAYLWRRQLESLAANAPRLLAWMIMLHLPDIIGGPDWVMAQTREEWARLKQTLDGGQPWPLCLVGSSRSPFDNHQVLAIGYEQEAEGIVRLFLYDMNCPGGEQVTRLDMRGALLVAQESCASPPRGALRGFFCEAYSPVVPPEIGGVR